MTALSSDISIDPDVRFGKPCISGTRITVGDVLQWLASGMSFAEIIEDFPELSERGIRAALGFAAERDTITRVYAGIKGLPSQSYYCPDREYCYR